MTRDFEEMQEDAPLVIDTSAIASVLDSSPPATPVAAAEKATGSRRTSTSTTTGKEPLRRSSRSRNKSSSNVWQAQGSLLCIATVPFRRALLRKSGNECDIAAYRKIPFPPLSVVLFFFILFVSAPSTSGKFCSVFLSKIHCKFL